jgi:hypothetical protein
MLVTSGVLVGAIACSASPSDTAVDLVGLTVERCSGGPLTNGHDRVMAVSDRVLSRTIADIVGTGAVSRETIEAELRARDLPTGERLDQVLQQDATFAEVECGLVHVPSLVEGTSWSAWVDADDATDDFIRVAPHLSPIAWWLVVAEVPLVDEHGTGLGVLTTEDADDDDIVVGPDGWLADLAGRWATVRVVAGTSCWTVCKQIPGATPAQARQRSRRLRAHGAKHGLEKL